MVVAHFPTMGPYRLQIDILSRNGVIILLMHLIDITILKYLINLLELLIVRAKFNKNGIIKAIPIVAYHTIDDSGTLDSNGINLFAKEMKYLYDNGFKVIPMYGLVYDNNNNSIHLVDVPGIT